MNKIAKDETMRGSLPEYGELTDTIVSLPSEAIKREMGRSLLDRASLLNEQYIRTPIERLHSIIGKISLLGIVSDIQPGIMTMARGGNYKIQRINLQQSGKANSKQKMSPEQKRARKHKRKKK